MQYTIDYKNYTIKDIKDILSYTDSIIKTKRGRMDIKKILYYNIPAAFDIETSSWYDGDIKKACMYIWQFGINGHVITGRTWKEFKTLINKLIKYFDLSENKRLIVYVQNLSYEFQFIRKLFKFSEVFEIEERKVIKALYKGIEFRCSYALSGKKLSLMGKELAKYKVDKKVGDLDYDLIRHSKTILTEKELGYCINDVLVVMSYIQEKIEIDNGIQNIPLTATGYIRNLCKRNCYKTGDSRSSYHKFIKRLTLTEDLYDMCKNAFMGGYVHCNPIYSDVKLENIAGFDYTSSYPAQMVAKKRFPMSSPVYRENVTKEQLDLFTNKYCCLFEINIKNIKLKDDQYIAPLSISKCTGKVIDEDNGRIVEGKNITTTITELDWDTMKKFYNIYDYEVIKMYTFERGYLPQELIEVIIKLYEEKTKYKGVADKYVEYLFAKSQLNATFGMMVTDVFKQYDSIEKYNNSYGRFLYYPWGIWTTALARHALFTGIYECGEDFVYCDTDSIKMLNYEKHLNYINSYNDNIKNEIKIALLYHGIDTQKAVQRDITGEERPLGIWCFEGVCDEFKAIRAKAYIAKKNEEYELTLSGVAKDAGIKYLKSIGNPIDEFNCKMKFPAGHTGKLTHTYIDEAISGVVVDHNGVEGEYEELSYIHMEPCGYDMNVENSYIEAVKGIISIALSK